MTICIVGSSGLTGGYVLQFATKSILIDRIVLPLRKKLQTEFANVSQIVCDFNNAEQLKAILAETDAIICCVGTTIKKAGSQDAFRKVDYHIPLILSSCAGPGTKTFVLLSSVGANKSSSNFYLRTKGEAEDAVIKHFKGRTIIARPSLLTGIRKEFRPAERLSMILSPLFNSLLHGAFKRFRSIPAETVAKALLFSALAPDKSAQYLHYPELIKASEDLDLLLKVK